MKINDRVSMTAIISDLCLGVSSGIHSERDRQNKSYISGRAYRGHIENAHKGVEDKNCRACKELRIKCNIGEISNESGTHNSLRNTLA